MYTPNRGITRTRYQYLRVLRLIHNRRTRLGSSVESMANVYSVYQSEPPRVPSLLTLLRPNTNRKVTVRKNVNNVLQQIGR